LQAHNPRIVTDGLVFNLDTLGGRGPNKIITKPTQIDGCMMWLDAADAESVVLSSSNVTNWLDKSGLGNHMSQGTSSYQPTWSATASNGKGGVTFDGSDNRLDCAEFTTVLASGASENDIIIVCKLLSSQTDKTIYDAIDGSKRRMLVISADGTYVSSYTSSTSLAAPSGGMNDLGSLNIFYTRYSNSGFMYKNGKLLVSGDNMGSGNPGFDDFRLGANTTPGDFCNCLICEVLIYNRALSTDERQSVELYLSRKWNIPIQTSHREQTSPSTIQSSSLPVSGFKNGKLDQVGDSMYFMGGPNTTGGYADWINCGSVLGNGGSYYSGDPFTYEVWAKDHGSETSWKTLIGSSSYAQIYFYENNSIRFSKNGGGDGGSHSVQYNSKQLHEWYHIAGVWVGGTHHGFSGDISTGPYRRILYVNGEEVGKDKEIFYGGNITNNYIGSYHSAGLERPPVELAVARIYNRDLTHAEIKQNYNAQSARIAAMPKIPKPGNLVLYLDAGMFESYKGSGSGTTCYDLSGEGNDGTLTNGATYDTTLPENDMGKSFVLDGVNDYIEVADAAELDITGDMTISCWVKMGSSENGNFCVIVSKRDNSDGTTPFTMYFDDRGGGNGVNRFGWYTGDGATSVGAQVDSNFDGVYDKWDHVVGTVSGTTMSLYVNGVLSATATFSGSRQTNNVGVKIGGPYTDGGTNYMLDGKISVVMIYNAALSSDEVVQNYNYHKHRYGK
jgi:hypothetical protein